MCESNAFLRKAGKDELLLENVTVLRPEKGRWVLSSLLGDTMTVDADIIEIDLMAHKIVLMER